MEDTLREKQRTFQLQSRMCLNPCFNGRYSQSCTTSTQRVRLPYGLNPCFNGRYSQSGALNGKTLQLVASLNPCFNGRYSQRHYQKR